MEYAIIISIRARPFPTEFGNSGLSDSERLASVAALMMHGEPRGPMLRYQELYQCLPGLWTRKGGSRPRFTHCVAYSIISFHLQAMPFCTVHDPVLIVHD